MSGDDEYGYTIGDVRVLRFTDKAVFVEVVESGEREWFPLSQIHDDSEIYDESVVDEEGVLVVSAWLAKQKGLL